MLYFLPVLIAVVFIAHQLRQSVKVEAARAAAFLAALEHQRALLLTPAGRSAGRAPGAMSMIAEAYLQGMRANLPRWLIRRTARCYTSDLLRNLP